jgi:hypothetical protein
MEDKIRAMIVSNNRQLCRLEAEMRFNKKLMILITALAFAAVILNKGKY